MILGGSYLQIPAIKKALALGHEVIVLDYNPDAPGFKIPNVMHEIISTIDTPNIIKAAKEYKIDGIMTMATDMPMQSIAAVNEELNLKGITVDSALKSTNKLFMRQALLNKNVPIPKYFKVDSVDEFVSAIKELDGLGFKAISKPADSSGSRGIHLIESFNYHKLEEIFNYSIRYSKSGYLLVEEYMEGPEVSVETISVDGENHIIQITDKMTTDAPYFIEIGHTQPSQLPKEYINQIKNITNQAINAVGISNGPTHTEVKVTKGGPKIVEIGARLGGDFITSDLTPLSTGVDMVEACIKIALSEEPDLEIKWEKASAIRFIKSDLGKIIDIQGLDEALACEAVIQVHMDKNIGDKVSKVKSSNDRVGYVITQAATANEAARFAELAIKKIKISIDEEN